MAGKTSIEWTDFNWNFLVGCSRKSAGCENCYAEKMTKRLAAIGVEKYKGLLNLQDMAEWPEDLQIREMPK